MNALLKKIKDQYDNVFAAQVNDQEFVFRELTRKEYRRILDDTYGNTYLFEEAVCQAVVLYPEEYDFSIKGRAGVSKTLSAEIIAVSGFEHPEQQAQLLEYYRADTITNFESQAETVIQLVFPSVTEEEMLDWTQEKFMRKLARAEWVMKEIWKMPLEFAKRNETDKEGSPPQPPTLEEIAADIREQGGDPMMVLKDDVVKKSDHNYVQFPMIGGTKLLQNEEVLKRVREQIQGLPKQ